ncbi:SusC/RagA family TonB-linked outer membrane protein [Mangrovibacterium diazotrophicum]|uniref:TonB-linked SusC/RagA family outer membrane protein n=1 Tax=Mangrovibacterium diazotrophicum TaxID=1261403 RepID=A0A419W5N7_9BACT|nr:SusC/RagA family TonB-linked outer membrane protein [Mangrovibacterium diazotrophicum]RKD90755.1 TonB-linked SusC/RagA family outer membrane protein [Mangrovibacterium diazotrophicum]
MKKLSLLFFVLVLLGTVSAMAQTVTGRVVSEGDNEPLPGVAVLEKGTNHGAATDFDGNYTFNLQNSEGAVLVFSFMGYETQEVSVDGRSSIDVVLKSNNIAVDEVVVTALGIKRESKTLTYSSQEVSGEEMMKARDVNFMSGLSGKTAGLEIRKSSSGAGGSTRTVLRGSKSVNSVSDPLYVIDGIPMVNNKGDQAGMWGGTDEGDGLSQLNPDDIESISVLKGATASILYGSQGANGVIIITTKKGKEGKTTVSFNSSAIFESVIETPDLQFSYGADGGTAESWSYTKGNYESDYVDDFFETGYNLINTVSVSSGNEKMSTYFSYGNTGAGGVVPNNSYQKHNVTFKQSAKMLDDKLTLTSNVMLTSERSKNRPGAGYYLNPLTGLYLFPRSGATPLSDSSLGAQPFSYFKDNYQYFMTSRNMNWQEWHIKADNQSNPYWLINKQPKTDLTKRVIASLTLDYQITEKLKFQARGSYDYANKTFEQKFYAGGNTVNISENGRWNYKKFADKQLYSDGIFSYQNEFGDLSLSAVAGASYQESVYGDGVSVDNGTNDLLYPNEFYFQNVPDNVAIKSIYGGKIIKEGVFGSVQLGFKDMLFLDLSGRNDWSSTLAATGNESYFYPAAGLTGILSQMVTMPEFISFAKVRASASQVNNEVPWGLIQVNHSINASGSVDRNTVKPFTDAKPEQLVTWELGTDWRFFNGRLGLDFTYYHITSTNQALSKTLSGSKQDNYYTSMYFNAGEIVNKGVEIVLNSTPVKTSDFEWNSSLNFSKNNNKVVELYPGEPSKYIDLGSSEGYINRIYTGGSIGDMYGIQFRRNDAGQILLDEDGTPLKTASDSPVYLGNLEPDFSLGWNNSFDYKRFTLSFLINAKIGGKAFSQTESILDGYGVSQRTADARDKGYVAVNGITEESGTVMTQIDPQLYYSTVGGRNGIAEAYVYDRTNIRLTQLALSYDLDVKSLGLPLQAASFSVVGNNLFFLYKKAPFDPELSMSTDLGSQSLDNFNVPATRTYGFNLKFTF